MKWRNQLLAIACLVLFAGLGVLYFKHWVVQKPFGIILFVAEGLAPERIAATRLYLGGAETRLALDRMNHVALVRSYSNDFAAADQAAAATALATGERVNNRAVAINSDGKPITNLIELARSHGRTTGLVTNGPLTNATSAAFYAHANNANNADQLALQFVESGKIDIALGAGAADFVPQEKGGRRQDNRDLVLEMRRNGYEIVRGRAELEAIPIWRRAKLFGLVGGDNDSNAANQGQEWNDQTTSLPDLVRRAIELLQYNPGGYVLIVDAARMRTSAEENNAEKTLAETAELDRAVSLAQHYAGPKSMVVVCGDMAIGGLHLNGFPFRKDSGIALFGLNPAGEPWMTWATGPKGLQSYGAAKLAGSDNKSTASPDNLNPEPAAFYTKSALNTVEDVLAFGVGRGSEAIQGTVDNTDIFRILRDEL